MYEEGKTEKNPNAKGLALLIHKNFTDYVENLKSNQTELSHVKFNCTEKHHYKSYKSMPVHATTTTKQWSCFVKNLKKLWTRKPAATT